ncbi:plasmid replication protein RepC [Mesorhizobium sp. CAU 1732]|uniref:plasmid replication protein RepC n=1 Tax=Mesorhizobium sp. CAU 1732 TaxID=3140358 RepID=UPI003260340A
MSTTESHTPHSWARPVAGVRQVTQASLDAQRAARRYAGSRSPRIKRVDALRIAKRAAAAMGLKAAKIAMIDKLFGFSPTADWESLDANPVVWPSNDALARQLGLSVSTTRYHLRGLAAAGLIAHTSHPTYQRRGVRNGQGHIVEAFGIDLSPIIMRYDELLEIALAYEQDGRERRELSCRRTQLRREIESVFAAARRDDIAGDWQPFQARLDRLREITPADSEAFHQLIDGLSALRDEVEGAFSDACERSNLDTAVIKFRQVQTTAESSPRRSSLAPAPRGLADSTHLRQWREPTSPSERRSKGSGQADADGPNTLRSGGDEITNVSLALVRTACPALAFHVPQVFDSWAQLRQSGRRLCAAASINPQVWTEAETHLGPDTAIAALAVTVQRAESGHVSCPGAYLRTLIQRGRKGQLRISRSLFALADRQHKTALPEIIASKPPDRGFPPGPISWTGWSELVRRHAPEPIPDAENVAEAFRAWCRKSNIDLEQPSIEVAFIGFCKKSRPRSNG